MDLKGCKIITYGRLFCYKVDTDKQSQLFSSFQIFIFFLKSLSQLSYIITAV